METSQHTRSARVRVVQLGGGNYKEYGHFPALGDIMVAGFTIAAIGGGIAALTARPRHPGQPAKPSRVRFTMTFSKTGVRIMLAGAAIAAVMVLCMIVGGLVSLVPTVF